MAVGLQLAGKNDFVRVQEDINDNLTKLDEAIDFNLLATLGIEYGGILNNTNAKVAGKAYYDTTGKKLYKCTANTSINYADAGFFVALSNNDLLSRLQNLQNSSVKIAEETFVWESGDGWSADITLQKFAKNGIVTKEVIRFSKPAERGNTIAKTYDITIPTSDKFPPKYWGVPLGVGTDDPAFGYGGSSVVEYPGRILLNFKSIVPNTNTFIIEYTWIYNL